MRNLIPLAALALLVQTAAALVPTAAAQGPEPSASEPIRVEECMVMLINNVRVSAEVEGKVTAMQVEEGAHVKAGDVLAVIDDTRAALALELKRAEEREAELNAENDVNLRDAINSEATARAEFKSYQELGRAGATPFWEMKKKELEADRALLRIELAKLQEEIAKVQYVAKQAERQLAEVEVDRRRVTAPFGGYVESRIGQLGEWVQPGSPILQLVQLDRLRVEGDIDAARFPSAVVPGTPVEVLIHASAKQDYKLSGRIGFVSSQMDLAGHYRVWVEIENVQQNGAWVIKPGMPAEMIFPGVPELARR